ncbi:DeoR/GlpR family DNA-binding transcription regulator [Candidatus Pseudothioglobus singularis]|jgi:DeoR family glycerol-3-phosphate regulon repressor|uniref:DeoR faimly transcriptional regulator n=1 Tax=Candidatus Pseudothioglobus singularis PS1 TaxID=1125411 RepID=A0A0M4LGC2_9GAMM|nr:DeoR/GlpR family DNA-binding transcription regulator [Candidatus Pseudothioglobus singularis]ALE01677.1 DeoR faimly transcriptional regulator [Candidatus Pseudothioglobus singularis PS1]ANQ66352.1 DeoR faimly transcriptional regulator [Candidatus Pseudothioglobus singularis]MDA7437847.1 DeoR/GlpR family DNA-binding transcription regulator [Candidatus Pseudothioglobus singularis]MDA7441246.1 DeoR/GlpR family DNA-binding transcription regulator [Candidatus Pseudothioglobus singularis]MDA87556|tara:strand:+ start:229 stop:1002 length:774 start_codon:yes stop_codon:yes gene_type:complete
MDLTARQAEISDLLRQEEFITVESLADRFSVTTQTVRRDINVLCDYGQAKRKHGGVEPLSTDGNLAYGTRQVLNRVAKRSIAKEVANQIPNGSSISLGIGTTPEMVVRALLKHKNLKIYTNNLIIAQTASTNSSFEVYSSGGRIRSGDFDMVGSPVENFFNSYKTDFGIFGVAGVDNDGVLLDFSDEEVQIRRVILDNCRESLLVLDHEKFGRIAHVRGGQIEEVTKVFCDQNPPNEIIQIIDDSESQLIICDKEDV